MGQNTKIEWADHTWSPWEGCTKVGPGCDHCYAESMNRWLRKGANWGVGAPRRLYSEEHWRKPTGWNKAAAKAGETVSVFPSVCDPFDNEVPKELRVRFFDLIEETPNLTWLLLTKRIGNVAEMVRKAKTGDWLAGRRNVWLGATVVDQKEADRDITKLLEVQARVRFLSIEPMLGRIDLNALPDPKGDPSWDASALHGVRECAFGAQVQRESIPKVDWVIAGGESGPGARPVHPDWIRSLRDQCTAAGVPFHFKQWGEWAPCDLDDSLDGYGPQVYFDDEAIHDRAVERSRFTVHRFPGQEMARVGKKAAGRLLDGRTHDEFPQVRA